MGRLGLFLQISANLGHQTIFHNWTLEIRSCIPLRVFPHQVIGQVSFWQPFGDEKKNTKVIMLLMMPQPYQKVLKPNRSFERGLRF